MPVIAGKTIEGLTRRAWRNAGAPSDGGGGTFAGIAEAGDLLIDTTNKTLYQNTNTQASPTWTQFAAGAGPTPIGLIGDMAAAGTGEANVIGVVTRYSPADHVHALGTHDHTSATKGGALVLGSIPDSVFTADATGRAKFANGFINTDLLLAAVLSADASGRAKIAAGFFDTATVNSVFAAGSIAGSKLASISIGDGVEIEFGDSQDAVLGWETGDADNHSFVIGLADANQALHLVDKTAIGTDWNVGADTHPSIYLHSDTTPATDYLKMFHDATDGWLRSVGGTLKLDCPNGSTVNICENAVVEYAFSDSALDMNANHLDNAGYLIMNDTTLPAGTEVYAGQDNTGDLTLNALTGKQVHVAINGTDEYDFSATALGMNNNAIEMGTGYIQFAAAGYADAGNIRLANDVAVWASRNQAGAANINGWKVNAEDDYEAAADVNLGGNTLLGGTAANADLTLQGTSNATKLTSYLIANNMLDCSVEGLATRVKAGAVGDGETNQTDLDGNLVIDSSNGRLYFRYGGAWHYVAQTAGMQIPKEEVFDKGKNRQMKVGDVVEAVVDKIMSDGALHISWRLK